MPIRLTPSAAVLLACALGGCATAVQTFGDPNVEPGKFQFLRCEDIAKRVAAAQSRNQELHALMDRAEHGVGGSAVNLFVYQPDLQSVDAELRLLRQTAGEKRCADEPVKAPPKIDLGPLH
jgi:hypothetical protein